MSLKKLTRHTVFLVFTLFIFASSAQKEDSVLLRKLVQFSGLVVQGDSLSPVSYSHVFNKTLGNGTSTDLYGFFSIVARPGDTLRFSAVGFKKSHYRIPDTLSSSKYSIVHIMSEDTIMLAPSYIYPWPSKELFAEAFLNAEIPNDDLKRAKKNLEMAALREQMIYMPMDGSLNYKWSMQQYQQKLYYAGQAPPIHIFNPFAWAQFIKAWKAGSLKNPEKRFENFQE
jgi:hypothetical protein